MENHYQNSSSHSEFELIQHSNNRTIFPKKYLEYFIDCLTDDYYEYDNTNYYVNSIIDISLLHNYIEMAFSIDNYITTSIPTIQTYISESLSSEDIELIKIGIVPHKLENFYQSIPKKQKYFFRLNTISPKDVCNCSVSHPEDIIKYIKLSDRTRYFLENPNFEIKIVLREWIEVFPVEFRLFVYDLKLRAISQNDNKNIKNKESKKSIYNEIIDFYASIQKYLVYIDCVIDIIKYNDKWLVLEMNPFGASLKTGSALFNWKSDYFLLHSSEIPVIRFSSKILN